MSTIKRSKSTGRTVSQVENGPKGITLFFEDGTKLLLSEAEYLAAPHLYPGKRLEESEIKKLTSSYKEEELLKYIEKISALGLYSKKKLRDKLMNLKKATREEADQAIWRAKELGIIDDDRYISAYIKDAAEKGMSEDKICSDLFFAGYAKDKIRQIWNQDPPQVDLNKLANQTLNSVSGRNLQTKKDNAVRKIMLKGYSQSEAEAAVEKAAGEDKEKIAALREKELAQLKIDMAQAVSLYTSRNKSAGEVKDLTFKRLISRKYAIDDIINTWEEDRRK
jgi:SOS response regulatory protein OraA/RecX